MKFSFLDSIHDISAELWNSLAGVDYPFLRHEFLLALEQSGSVSASNGWKPQHLVLIDKQLLIAIAPMYLKQHSYGEFVFDHAWAEAYYRHGLDYYPKLLNAIPYTPCTGPRIAYKNITAETLAPLLAECLKNRLTDLNASSWHCLFADNEQSNLWLQTGADRRIACHFHWLNNSYENFEEFLQACQPRKRKELKRERKKILEQGVSFKRIQGTQITDEHISQFYLFYQLTNAKYNGHGGYLNEAFFQQLLKSMSEQMLLILAFKNEQCIAGALNFFSSSTLYGRYWGCTQEHDFLHFETCFYQGIEFCIEKKLQVFDPGAQGEHKIKRGFTPILTQSFHYLAHPQFRLAVKNYLLQEHKAVLNYQQQTMELLPFIKEKTAD